MKHKSIFWLLLIQAVFILGCTGNKPLPQIVNKWKEYSAEYSGKPLRVKMNIGLKAVIGHPSYNHQIGISIPFNNSNTKEREEEKLKEIENTIITLFSQDNLCLPACVLSSHEGKLIILYTGNPKKVKQEYSDLDQELKSHKLNITVLKDPKWITYVQYSS